MKKLIIILFCLGIFIEFFSFCLSQIEHLPWMSEIVSPAYAQGMQGIEKLEANETLLPKDTGFSAISNVIMLSLRKLNPPELLREIAVQKIVLVARKADIKIGGKSILGDDKSLKITLTNGQELPWTTGDLRTNLVKVHLNKLFVVACWFFAFGVFLQLCGFWLHVVKGKKRKWVRE